MLKHLFGKLAPEAVLAVPGYLRVGEATGEPLPDWIVRWDDEGVAAEDVLVARWAAESSKRYLAAMVAVGTVDQAMLGALCVKHSHLRSAALLPFNTPFSEVQFPSDEEQIRTRLGEEGARVTFKEPVPGPFGERISGLTMPAHWSHGLQTSTPLVPVIQDQVLTLTIENVSYTYDRRGMMKTRQ